MNKGRSGYVTDQTLRERVVRGWVEYQAEGGSGPDAVGLSDDRVIVGQIRIYTGDT
jgi:hypothetical protein